MPPRLKLANRPAPIVPWMMTHLLFVGGVPTVVTLSLPSRLTGPPDIRVMGIDGLLTSTVVAKVAPAVCV